MALINFVAKYETVSKYKDLTVDSPRLDGSTENDYNKLFFTKDGHIITHGTDYTPWGIAGIIPINRLPVDNTKTDNEHLWDSATINDTITKRINDSYVVNSAMRFKGTIGLNPDYTSTKIKYIINGVKADLPESQVGDTYRVVTSGTYEGFKCESGDLFMCITAGDKDHSEWTVAQTNINGTVDYLINNVVHKVYSNDTVGLTIFAPESSGSNGQILVSSGDNQKPIWANPINLTVGTAEKVKNALSNGNGIAAFSYDGSASKKVTLLPATTSSIGGVSIDGGGTDHKPTISVDSYGKIFLTRENLENAFGGSLSSKDTWRDIQIGGVSIGNKILNIDASGDIYISKAESETDNKVTIDFGIAWYNLDTKEYETV